MIARNRGRGSASGVWPDSARGSTRTVWRVPAAAPATVTVSSGSALIAPAAGLALQRGALALGPGVHRDAAGLAQLLVPALPRSLPPLEPGRLAAGHVPMISRKADSLRQPARRVTGRRSSY